MVMLTDPEFQRFQQWLHQVAGIWLAPSKRSLVQSRLGRRVEEGRHLSFGAYFNFIQRDTTERQKALDALTTNETYFFREPKHFEWMRKEFASKKASGRGTRVWSAAASSGQEAYSVAMLAADTFRHFDWEVVGTDISSRVLDTARSGLYDMEEADGIPKAYLQRYALKGVGTQDGKFMLAPEITRRVKFLPANLTGNLPELGVFDVILLRNVMIYFQPDTKGTVVRRLVKRLKPGGLFIIGQSETLNGLDVKGLTTLAPSVYRWTGSAADEGASHG